MSRVRKLQEGNKVSNSKDTKPKVNLFETARGNINYDDFYDFQLRNLDDDIKSLNLTGEAANAFREESIKYLDGIKSGNITKFNSDNTFNISDSTNFKDYRNWNPQINKANWWEKNMNGKSDSYVQDADYGRNKAISHLSSRINQWDTYKEPEVKVETKKKSDFLYNYDNANPDLLKEVFRGGEWDDKVWSGYDNKTKLNYIANTIQNKINTFNPEERDWNYSNKMGFDSYDSWKTAATNAVTAARNGVLDDNLYNIFQSAGLGGFRQLLDKNYSLNGTSNSEEKPKKETIKHGIDSNIFSDTYGKVFFKGKEYNSIEEIDTDEDLSDFYNAREVINENNSSSNYFDFDKGFETPGDYILKNDINQLDKINWSDNKKRRQVLDQSSYFSGLSNGNKLYSFKGNGVDEKHLFFDKNENKNIEIDKIYEKNGVYHATGKNGETYFLGNPTNAYDISNSSLIGTNQSPIIKNEHITTNNKEDNYIDKINSQLGKRLYELINYDVTDDDVNRTLEALSILDSYENEKFRLNVSDIEGDNVESAMSKVWTPIIKENKLIPKDGIYNIPINLLLKKLNKESKYYYNKITSNPTLWFNTTKKVPMIGNNYIPYDERKDKSISKKQKGGYISDGGYKENSEVTKVDSNKFSSSANWNDMSSDEKAILGATLADIGSMALTFVPGANVAGAGIGAGASLTRFAAGGSDGFGLATDLALDAVSLIPGAKLAKAPKLFKSLGKFIGKVLPPAMTIMSAGQIIGHSDEFTALIDKVNKNGVSSLNVNDWKKIATITGALVSGRATLKSTIPSAVKSGIDKNIIKPDGLISKIVYKNPNIKSSINIDVDGKSYSVPLSKNTYNNYKNIGKFSNKSNVNKFNEIVTKDIDSNINKYIVTDESGKITLKDNAPEYVKDIVNLNKTESGRWNYNIEDVKKVGKNIFKRNEVNKLSNEIDSDNLRRAFKLSAIDYRTAEQLDQGFNRKQLFNTNKEYINYNSFKPTKYPLGQSRFTNIVNDLNEHTKSAKTFVQNMKSKIKLKDGGIIMLQSGGKSRLYNNMYYNPDGILINGADPNIPLSDTNGNAFQLNNVEVTAKRPGIKLLNVTPSKALTDIQSGNIKIPSSINVNSNLSNVAGYKNLNELSQEGNGLLGKINPSSLLNAGNLAVGLHMANQSYNAAKKFQPTILTAPTLYARTPQGNEVLNQFYRKTGLDVLSRLDKTKTADQNYNTAALLEGTKYANEMSEKGALANDQEIKRTTELADRIEQQNIMARNSVANQNTANYVNAINMKNDLKARHIGNMYNSLINPYLTEMRHNYNQKQSMSDQIALEEMNKLSITDYENNINDLSDSLTNNFNIWKSREENKEENKGKTFNESDYLLSTEGKILKKKLENDKKNFLNKTQSDLLNNRKTLLNNYSFKTGGKIKYLDTIKEFNKNLERNNERFIKDVQNSINRSIKNSIDNTKLAKNIIYKIK